MSKSKIMKNIFGILENLIFQYNKKIKYQTHMF
jgi:hypothetical protein